MTKQIDDKVNELPDAGAKGEGETSELLPCPMCNGRASVVEPVTGRIWRFYIRCKDCGMRTENLKSKDYAITAWNRRSDAALAASCQEKEKMQPIEGFEKVIICADRLLDCINEFESIEPAGEIIDALQSAIDALGENAVFDFKYKSTPGVYYPAAEVDAALAASRQECERLREENANILKSRNRHKKALKSSLAVALAERDAARATALEEAANAAIEVVDDWIENLSAAAFDDKYNHSPDEPIGDVIRRHISTKLSTVGATGERE